MTDEAAAQCGECDIRGRGAGWGWAGVGCGFESRRTGRGVGAVGGRGAAVGAGGAKRRAAP